MTTTTFLISTAELTTRLVTEQDRQLLYELYKTTRAWEMAQVAWSDEQKEMFLQQQFNAQRIQYAENYPDGSHEIIVQNGRSIGRLYTAQLETELRLLDIVLLPETRNQGIGSILLQHLQEQAQQANIPLRFYVWQLNNNAQRFYQRHGCRVIDEAGAYILMEWQPQEKT